MRGHEALIELRRRGLRPASVSVHMEPCGWDDWSTWQTWTTFPQVEVMPSDRIGRLDLRCFVGLQVVIAGFDGERLRSMFDACKAAGAKRVIALEQRVNERGTVDTVDTLDSMGEANGSVPA